MEYELVANDPLARVKVTFLDFQLSPWSFVEVRLADLACPVGCLLAWACACVRVCLYVCAISPCFPAILLCLSVRVPVSPHP